MNRTMHINTIHRLQLLVQKHRHCANQYQRELDRAAEALVRFDRRQNGEQADRSAHDTRREHACQG